MKLDQAIQADNNIIGLKEGYSLLLQAIKQNSTEHATAALNSIIRNARQLGDVLKLPITPELPAGALEDYTGRN